MRKRKPTVEKTEDEKHIEHMKREMKRIGQKYIPIKKEPEETIEQYFERLEKGKSKNRNEELTDDENNIMRQIRSGGID